MVAINHNDFMRAIYYHKLNVTYDCCFKNGACHGTWKLGIEVVCKDVLAIPPNRDGDDLVTEAFKKRYIDTTPDNAFRCRTCARINTCGHVHSDVDRFCGGWIDE